MRLLSPSGDWMLDRGIMCSLSSLRARPEPGSYYGSAQVPLAFPAVHTYTPWSMKTTLSKSHDTDKTKLVKRLSRIRGQVDALQRAILEHDAPSAKLLQQARACRGAMDGFIAEVIEDQIREVVTDVSAKGENTQATEALIGLVHTYLT